MNLLDKEFIEWLFEKINSLSISEIVIETPEAKVKLKKGGVFHGIQQVDEIERVAKPAPQPPEKETPEKQEKKTNTFFFNSPMVGTFYIASSPGAPPFVTVNDVIKKGQTICIIEAMKLFNEIQYDGDRPAKVVRILVENGTPVQYGQPLFELEHIK